MRFTESRESLFRTLTGNNAASQNASVKQNSIQLQVKEDWDGYRLLLPEQRIKHD